MVKKNGHTTTSFAGKNILCGGLFIGKNTKKFSIFVQEVHRDMQKSTTWKLRLFPLGAMAPVVLPLIEGGVSAGFPSPAADFMDNRIDLNKYLIQKEATTFIAFAEGHSMEGAGIGHKDLLIIDKSLEPEDGKIAVCVIDGEFTLKRLKLDKSGVWLMPEHEAYKPIRVTEFNQFEIWGIVTFSIQKH